MKSIVPCYVLALHALTFSAYASTTEEYQELACDIKLRVRPIEVEQEDPSKRPGNELVPYTHPLIPLKKGTSNNWCGYVAAKNLTHPIPGSVTAVYGTWIVPQVMAPSQANTKNTYSSLWIGIDGYNNGTVEQIGTAHEWHNGKAVHYAWFEMYPNAAFEITGFPLNPGDSISATIEYKGNNVFQMTLANNTRKVQTTVPTVYTTSSDAVRACAEWIAEAPYMNGILPLAHFSPVPFSRCIATITGVTGSISDHVWHHDNIMMKNALMVPKATASTLQESGQSFTVTWLHE